MVFNGWIGVLGLVFGIAGCGLRIADWGLGFGVCAFVILAMFMGSVVLAHLLDQRRRKTRVLFLLGCPRACLVLHRAIPILHAGLRGLGRLCSLDRGVGLA